MNTLTRKSNFCSIFVLLLTCTGAYANNSNQDAASDKTPFSVKGELKLDYSNEFNFELDDEDEEYVYVTGPSLELEIEYDNDDDLRLVFSIEYGRELEDGNEGKDREFAESLDVNESYVELSDVMGSDFFLDDVTVTLGRRKISDSREWFFDAEVDGVILEATLPKSDIDLMVSVNREEWIGSDLLRHNETDTVNNLVLKLEHEPLKDLTLGAYAIVRRDSSEDNDSPHFLGLSMHGELFDKQLGFWSDFAVVGGEEDDETIDGNGFDIGATFTLPGPRGPYFTLGYAFGSGDGDEDTDFRQTGLHGNSDRFGGVTTFNYYGELVDPELSNLKITTVGIGYKPSKGVSVDLVYHRYAQDEALDQLRDSNLDKDPNGREKDIGAELDLVAGFTSFKDFHTELLLGYFMPGTAFNDASDAWLFGATVSYEF